MKRKPGPKARSVAMPLGRSTPPSATFFREDLVMEKNYDHYSSFDDSKRAVAS